MLVIDCLKTDTELNYIKLTEKKAISLQSSHLIVYVYERCLEYPVSCGHYFGIDNFLIVTTDGDVMLYT